MSGAARNRRRKKTARIAADRLAKAPKPVLNPEVLDEGQRDALRETMKTAPERYDLAPGPTPTEQPRLVPFPRDVQEEDPPDPAPPPQRARVELTAQEAWDVRGLLDSAAQAEREAQGFNDQAQRVARGAAQRAGVVFEGEFMIHVDSKAGAVLVQKVTE